VGLSGNGSGYVFLSNVLPWNASTGLSNNTVDLGNSSYQFKDLYVGNVITPAGTLGNATQIQPASGVGQSGVAFRDAVTGSAADVSAGVMYVDAIDATGSIITDSYVEGNELISLGNLTVGDNANIANGIKVGGYANFLGNLKAENIAAVTNIEAQFYYGNGFYLTGINAANLIGAYSNTNVANYLPIYNGNILAGNLTVSNNVIIQGNLQVLGNTTTINANTLTINDLDIIVANGASTPSQANGAGLIVGASNIANIIYLSTPNYWSFNPGIYTVGNITTESNVNVTGNITANNATIVNTLTADNGNFTCCLEIGGATTTYFQAYTTSNAANQTLYEANAAASAQLDFNIIATDPTLMGGSRQSSKILSTTYGNSTDFVEYGGVYINTPVGDFAVDQANGNVRLLVSPQTNANIGYSILVTRLV
jgi:cytoskeletal protein CcmA (bactofilin family)